jgi:hypothetical protein
MTSQINPNNIDGTYPVAGVPNNTQGMRDNFTNTRTNFQYASDEITELQNKSVLKAAITGTTLDNNMNDQEIYAVELRDVSYAYSALTATAGSINIDYSVAPFQQINLSGPISLSFSNWPTAGTAGVVRVGFNITNVSQTVTLPAAVSQGVGGLQGYASSVITFAATGVYQFEFTTVDGGTTITINDLSRPLLGTAESAVGYSTGTGGTVTQASSKSTGVTLNKRCGEITMQNSSLSAATTVQFTLTNSTIGARDLLILNVVGGVATGAAYNLDANCSAGSAVISVRNVTAGSLSEALVLRFAVIKGAIT